MEPLNPKVTGDLRLFIPALSSAAGVLRLNRLWKAHPQGTNIWDRGWLTFTLVARLTVMDFTGSYSSSLLGLPCWYHAYFIVETFLRPLKTLMNRTFCQKSTHHGLSWLQSFIKFHPSFPTLLPRLIGIEHCVRYSQ